MDIRELSDEELDDLSVSILIEKMTREGMRRLTVSDLYDAKDALDRRSLFGGIAYTSVPMPLPMPIMEARYLKDSLESFDIDPLDTEIFGVRTGFNPYPMFGVNPNDVFNGKKKSKGKK